MQRHRNGTERRCETIRITVAHYVPKGDDDEKKNAGEQPTTDTEPPTEDTLRLHFNPQK